MHSIPRDKLRQLVLRFGKELGQDARRCEALLRDVCGSYRKEIFALASAVREGIPAELVSSSAGIPPQALFARLAQRLQENLGISQELCEWTVETWAYALGVITKRDLLPVTHCPSCDAAMKIPEKLRGKEGKCPKCGARLLIDESGSPNLPAELASSTRPKAKRGSAIENWPPDDGKQGPDQGRKKTATGQRINPPISVVDAAGRHWSEQGASDLPLEFSSGVEIAAPPALFASDARHVSRKQPIDAEIVLPSSETAQDVFRQVVLRWIAADGGLQQKHMHYFEQARVSLGLSTGLAEQIIREVQPAAPPSQTATVYSRSQQSTVRSPGGAWYVRPTSGGQFGPVDEATMRNWVAEGRVTCFSLLWSEGWADWRPAGEIFPQLVDGGAVTQPIYPPNAPAGHQPTLANALSHDCSAPDWNPGVALALSLVLPGLGQLYKGEALKGVGYFIAVVMGYAVCLVLPGIVLHVVCIVDAAANKPAR